MRFGILQIFLKEAQLFNSTYKAQLFASTYRQQSSVLSFGIVKLSHSAASPIHGSKSRVETIAVDRRAPVAGVSESHGSSFGFQECRSGKVCEKSQNLLVKRLKRPQVGENAWFEKKKNKKWQRNISPMALDLVEKVQAMSDVKEEIYKALDKWVAFSMTFPITDIKRALKVFKQKRNWDRVIQVSKWMLSKGQGKTLGTYKGLLEALDMQGRTQEAELVWENNIHKSSWSVPNRMIGFALKMYERHNKPIEVIKLFTSMEERGRNLDPNSVRTAARAYQEAGFLEKSVHILRKYNLLVQEGGTSQTHAIP